MEVPRQLFRAQQGLCIEDYTIFFIKIKNADMQKNAIEILFFKLELYVAWKLLWELFLSERLAKIVITEDFFLSFTP